MVVVVVVGYSDVIVCVGGCELFLDHHSGPGNVIVNEKHARSRNFRNIGSAYRTRRVVARGSADVGGGVN